jgi:hypothetical protein
VAECLPSKYEALSLNPSTITKKKKKERKDNFYWEKRKTTSRTPIFFTQLLSGAGEEVTREDGYGKT